MRIEHTVYIISHVPPDDPRYIGPTHIGCIVHDASHQQNWICTRDGWRRLCTSTTRPAVPVGDTVIETDTERRMRWDGNEWTQISDRYTGGLSVVFATIALGWLIVAFWWWAGYGISPGALVVNGIGITICWLATLVFVAIGT